MARALTQWIDVRPGEAATVRLLFAFAFSLGLAQVYLASATISLFLGAFPPSMLPFGYIGIALAMPLVGWAHGWLEQRFSLPRLVLINLVLMAASLLGWRWLIELPWDGWLLLLYVWWVVVWSVLNLALWGLVGRIFDLRQSKRLNGVVGAGEVLAMILGGLSVALLVGPIGTPGLLLVSMAAIILAILLLGRISSVHRARLEGADGPDEGSADQGVLVQFKDRYLRLIFINSALAWVVFYVVDNAFFNIASVRFPTEAEMAILVGRMDAMIGALLLLSRLFLSARLLAWVGVRGGLLVIPLVIGTGALSVVLAGQLGAPAGLIFALAATVKIFEEVCRDSIFRATLQVLFQPLPPGRRLRAQVTTESMVDPFAAALAAGLLLLLVGGLGFDTVRLYQVLLGLFLIWAVLAWRLQFQYLSSLRRALARRAAAGSDADVFEGASSEILQQALYSHHPSEIQHAMAALLKLDPEQARGHLPRLLSHSQPDVRCMALRWTAAENQTANLDEVRRLAWHDARGRVRSEALRTLAALLGDTCVDELPRALSDPVDEVRAGATVGLIRHGGIQGILLAGNDLLEQVASSDPRQRRSAATVVGEIGIGAFYQPLLRLLADDDPQVQQAALQSAARLRNEALWPAVLPTLDRASLRGYAIEALRAGGASAALAVAQHFASPGLDLMQRSRLLRVLGVIDHSQARRSLLGMLDENNRELREQALLALVRQRALTLEADRDLLLERVEAERADAIWLLQQICACKAEGELSILSPLREQLAASRRRLLLLLQLCLDREAMAQVRDRINDPSLERRAYALELLDNLLRGELRTRLLALFEGTSEQKCLTSLGEPTAAPLAVQQRRLLIEASAAEWGCSWLQATTLCALDPADPASHERVRLRLANGVSGLTLQALHWWQDIAAREHTAAQRSEVDWQFGGINRVGLLRQVELFAQAGDSVLARIAERLGEMVVSRGQVIFEQDEPEHCLYVIAAGTMSVHLREGERDSASRRIATLHAPEIFGEFSLLDERPRSATVKAETLSRLYRLEHEDFYDMLFDQPEITRRLIRLLGERLRSQSGYGVGPELKLEAHLSAEVDRLEALSDPLRRRMLLKAMPLLRDLPEPLIASIAAELKTMTARAGQCIYQAGDLGRSVYLIAAGRIKLHRAEQLLTIRGARDLFGDFSILEPRPHLSSATALEACLLLRLDKDVLQDLLMLWPELARNMLRDLVLRNRAAMNWVEGKG